MPGLNIREDSIKMSVCAEENRPPSSSSSSMKVFLFHKSSYADGVLLHLNALRQQSLFTDVVLHAGLLSFPCHRAVLAACSRYFKAMFSVGLKESYAGQVDFQASLEPEVLELLLDYAYTSRLLITQDNAQALLEAGDMLEFQDVRDACAHFLETNLHPSNCLGMARLAEAHQCPRLAELSWAMSRSHFPSLCGTEDFLELCVDEVLSLLSHEELETEDERPVYEAALRWVRHDPGTRRCHLVELLGAVRLALLPALVLTDTVATEELIRSQSESRELVEEAVRCKLRILQNQEEGGVDYPMARPRKTSHALFLLGGQSFMCDQLYLVDPRAKEITPQARLPSPRKEFSASAVGCRVFLTGGRGSENGVSKDVWVYDTAGGAWSKAAPMLVARFAHGSAQLRHCLYVVGGHTAGAASPPGPLRQVERYDTQTNQWSMVAPLAEGVSNAAVVSLGDKLYAFGGTRHKLPKVQCYDPDQDRWTVPASCPLPWRYTAAAVLNGQVLVMGGDSEFSPCSAYRFCVERCEWSRLGEGTARRMSCQAASSGNRLYVVGGYCGSPRRCKTLDCYDPVLDSWSSVSTVPYSLIPTAFVSTWRQLPA